MATKYTKHKQELREILDQTYLKLRYFVDDFISESTDYKDFETRVKLCDDLIDPFLEKLRPLTDNLYSEHSETFVPEEVSLAATFQSNFLVSLYYTDPLIFDPPPHEVLSKTLIDMFSKALEGDFNLEFLEKSFSAKRAKTNEIDVIVCTFTGEYTDSPMVYNSMFFPFRYNEMLDTETAVPFGASKNDDGSTHLFCYPATQNGDAINIEKMYLETYKKQKDLDVVAEYLDSSSDAPQPIYDDELFGSGSEKKFS